MLKYIGKLEALKKISVDFISMQGLEWEEICSVFSLPEQLEEIDFLFRYVSNEFVISHKDRYPFYESLGKLKQLKSLSIFRNEDEGMGRHYFLGLFLLNLNTEVLEKLSIVLACGNERGILSSSQKIFTVLWGMKNLKALTWCPPYETEPEYIDPALSELEELKLNYQGAMAILNSFTLEKLRSLEIMILQEIKVKGIYQILNKLSDLQNLEVVKFSFEIAPICMLLKTLLQTCYAFPKIRKLEINFTQNSYLLEQDYIEILASLPYNPHLLDVLITSNSLVIKRKSDKTYDIQFI